MENETTTGQALVTSFPKHRIKVLLLEGIHASAHELVERERFQLEAVNGALDEQQLVERVGSVHVLGIRSKTEIPDRVIQAGRRLLGIGSFCIGTNQVDLASAKRHGVPVFNAPFSNTRSVAELVLAEIIMLSRCLGDRVGEMHRGVWSKVAGGSYEVRGKTLGVIGYGHIGVQVGILAEALGVAALDASIRTRILY